jgi:enamine deaminase RidA (YjgF/YER057c/UK114 family)
MPIDHALPQPARPLRTAPDPAPRAVRTVYVSGQNSIDESGAVAARDLYGQTAYALRHVEAVVARSGGDLGHVLSWSIAVVEGHDLRDGFAAVGEIAGAEPSAISALPVRSLGRPDLIVEVSAVAAIPVG